MKRRPKIQLNEFTLFEDTAPECIEELEAASQLRTMEKGRLLYLPGDPSNAVFLLASGRVKIARLSDHGKELILSILEPGDLFGETGVLEDKPRHCVAEVLEPGEIVTISARGFRRALERDAALLMKLTQYIGRRQTLLETRLMDMVYKNAPQRLAELLIQLSESYGVRDSRGILLRIKLSQSALGNLLGVSREIVNHTFSGLRRSGVIAIAEGRVIIQNPDALAALAA